MEEEREGKSKGAIEMESGGRETNRQTDRQTKRQKRTKKRQTK